MKEQLRVISPSEEILDCVLDDVLEGEAGPVAVGELFEAAVFIGLERDGKAPHGSTGTLALNFTIVNHNTPRLLGRGRIKRPV